MLIKLEIRQVSLRKVRIKVAKLVLDRLFFFGIKLIGEKFIRFRLVLFFCGLITGFFRIIRCGKRIGT